MSTDSVNKNNNNKEMFFIWSFHIVDDEYYNILGYDTVSVGNSLLSFWRSLLPPFLG
jgi:hypothetical protein